jgi:hypothetical protein
MRITGENMKLIQVFSLSALLSATIASAAPTGSVYSLVDADALDFSAPSVYDRTNLAEAPVGTIVYDSNSGAFYGLSSAGDPSSATSWVQLGGTATSGNVVSQGTNQRIERATFTNTGSCAVASQSGTWVSNLTDPGDGKCGMTIAGFASTPTCVCSQKDATSYVCQVEASSSTTLTISTNVGSTGAYADRPFNLICMGDST